MRFNISPHKTLEETILWGRNEIDVAAGAARARYITTVPGQDATYSAKYSEAKAFVAAGYPEASIAAFPWVKAEALATGQTYSQAADTIKSTGDPWNYSIGPQIEGLRIGGKAIMMTMTDLPLIVAHTRKFVQMLGEI